MDQYGDISIYGSEEEIDLRRGPWTVEEDGALANFVARHGEGRWNSLACCAGLKRTGKSCRLRWLNYLRPGLRRGNITLEEQLLILELHTRWGNRWSKIAQHLPGRTDNEIKNYWRTRVEKHAKQLKCDVNSKQFRDTMRHVWIPRLVEKIQAAATTGGGGGASVNTSNITNLDMGSAQNLQLQHNTSGGLDSYAPESSSSAVSSDSLGTPVSDVTDCVNNYNQDYHPAPNYDFCYGDLSPISNSNQWLDFTEQNCNQWMDGGDVSDSFWDVDDTWILRGQFDNNF